MTAKYSGSNKKVYPHNQTFVILDFNLILVTFPIKLVVPPLSLKPLSNFNQNNM